MQFTVSKVQVSDAKSIAQHVHVPAMQNGPLYKTMFPQAATMTEAQKHEVIDWYSDMLTDAFEDGSESFLKVSSADGSPVGFCGWTAIQHKEEAIGRPKQERRKATWMPETLDQGAWIDLSKTLRAERNRVLRDFDNITRLTFMAVSPKHQRQGLGSMMMQQVCEETDRHGRCVYVLAAPEGVRLYAKFGFETIGCVETAQGTITSMLRPCRDL
ncbi:hypothetical protein V8C44DRAFT_351844 [Trichoderma aethiopicum]